MQKKHQPSYCAAWSGVAKVPAAVIQPFRYYSNVSILWYNSIYSINSSTRALSQKQPKPLWMPADTPTVHSAPLGLRFL